MWGNRKGPEGASLEPLSRADGASLENLHTDIHVCICLGCSPNLLSRESRSPEFSAGPQGLAYLGNHGTPTSPGLMGPSDPGQQ